MKKYFYVLVILAVVLFGVGAFASFRNSTPTPVENPKPIDNRDGGAIACTMDAKMCPDGSYVGRSGPKCEFTACPGPSEQGVALGQKTVIAGISITPLEVISDSRCPVDVTCVWAGEIQVKVKLEKGSLSKEVVMKILGADGAERVVFAGSAVALTEVTPKGNYRFTFRADSVVSM